ncbi:hypothetical protein EON63_21460 [archaeon]|nr:MAG: hypothetical protein EON63_21460 [archaeon]
MHTVVMCMVYSVWCMMYGSGVWCSINPSQKAKKDLHERALNSSKRNEEQYIYIIYIYMYVRMSL